MADKTETDVTLSMSALIEGLLFVSSGPVPVSRLAKALDISSAAARQALAQLEENYAERGIRLQWADGAVQLTTAPEASGAIEQFLGLEVPVARLSQAALEVLAIIAYMQPITRPQIDEIRGVNSDAALRTLLSKGLLEEVGRMDGPGRPILYGTTPEFMQHFGLSNLTELPELEGDELTLEGERGQAAVNGALDNGSVEKEN